MTPGTDRHDPIAIIGIGCRFPGKIRDAHTFWDFLINNNDALTKIPELRFGNAEQLTDSSRSPGKIVINQGGFLENIDQFDAAFFGISGREAELMDPHQRLALEIAFEAIEDAGLPAEQLAGSNTGVYIGQWTGDYESRVRQAQPDIDLYATLGTGRYATAGRVSYAFDLRGPSLVIDTHCSSSLVSVHTACQALRSGEVDQALAGGVNAILDPFISVGYSRSGILSDYGQCKFGDESGSGYVRSEGAGMVMLKRLSDAVADGNEIYGVIRASVVNNDGRSNKYMVAPSQDSQADLLAKAYNSAGVSPSEVHYIEAHGTGTRVGDPTEIGAIERVLGPGRKQPCVIGSVKTNIGHTEAAAGIAGLLKTVMIVRHRQIPASLHMTTPNQKIDWDNIPFRIAQENVSLRDLPGQIVAGVNSFGITGTNAHVVLEEYQGMRQETVETNVPSLVALPISANSDKALSDYSGRYADILKNIHGNRQFMWLSHITQRKSALRNRKAIVADSVGQLLERLSGNSEDLDGIQEGLAESREQEKIIFVFPGQGSQWPGMGRELFDTEPVFRDEILLWEAALAKLVSWKLTDELFDTGPQRLASIDVIQPALVAIESALARLWNSWGVQPDAVLGHSMGEVAAAYIAGCLKIDDAATVICQRSALMKTTSGLGAMGYIGLAPEAMEERLKPYEGKLGIAVNNSPDSVVVSGDAESLDSLLEDLTTQEVFCRKIKVDVASHSPQMDPITDLLKTNVSQIRPIKGTIAFYSTVHQDLTEGSALDPVYWVKNLRQPVQFAKTVQKIIKDGGTTFLEMSPHPVLLQAIRENAGAAGKSIATGGSLLREEAGDYSFLKAVAGAWCQGVEVDWSRLYGAPAGSFRELEIPAYPWDRERFWVDESGIDRSADWEAKSGTSQADKDTADAEGSSNDSFRKQLENLEGNRLEEMIEARIKQLTGAVVRRSPDAIKSTMAFKTLGIDSLMAVQLKEKLERELEVPVSVTSFWTYATIREYVQFILGEMDLGSNSDEDAVSKPSSNTEDISDDDISDLLASELEDLT